MKTKIIAEVGPNHNGDIKIAKEIVDRLKNQGVDFIKFQISKPNDVYSKEAFFANYQKKNVKEDSIIEMSKKIQLSRKEHKSLYDHCNKLNIRYACSAFDLDSLKYIYRNFNLPFFKIPSCEIFSLDILDYIKNHNLPIIVSTGASNINDINFTLNYLQQINKRNITIMHCLSSYPAKISDVNMEYMLYLKKTFNMNIGYSDHTIGGYASLVAASMGAKYIEKHITLDRNLEGPDHKSSMEIDEFLKLVKEIKLINRIKGTNKKIINSEILNVKNVAMKSCVAKKNLNKNKILKKSDVCFKRPGIGISPKNLMLYIGKKLKKNIKKDHVIFEKDIVRN